MRVNRPKSYPSYVSALRHFMCYTNKLNYPKDWVFSVEELSPISPKIVWDPLYNHGNPTKSTEVNDLIAFVKKKETRGQGKKSQADRPFEHSEFKQVLDTCHASVEADFDRKYRYPAMMKFMFHFIARGDDAAHVFKSSLVPSMQYPWALTCKLRWSKNVRESHECPHQILLGSMNPDYCVMLSLSVFLEAWISRGQGRTSQWLFSDDVTSASSANDEIDMETHQKVMSLLWIRPHRPIEPWPIIPPRSTQRHMRGGEESLRTSSTSGMLKTKKSTQDTYTDTFSLGPTSRQLRFYALEEYYNIKSLDNWLSNHVCPGISSCFGPRVAAILAKPLLWAAMDEVWCNYLPDGLRLRIMNSLAEDAEHLQVQTNVNPVEKVTVLVAEVPEFSEVDPEFLGTSNTGLGGGGGGPLMMEWRNFVTAKICGMENRMHDLQSNQGGHHGELVKRLDKIERNLRRMSVMPGRRGAAAVGGGGVGGANESQAVMPANLCKCPKNLYVLWAEFESGVGGNKPARLFTASERGKVKFKYCRRKIVWDVIDNLVRRGLSSD
ncbi:LOW QUALITY PROTEIN: hypothetical protein ACHAW5_008367 [Stephanodiscus triporus]|uniref:Uncharacterized protein n=1 Tax=Stephanodiscus triporus TaxID=2934178 RepID=A0ABD3MJ12_9STRA